MRVIKQAERAWNKVYDDIELPDGWQPLDRSFSLLPNEVQQLIALTAQQYAQGTRERLELVHDHRDLHKGDRIRIVYTTGEFFELIVVKIHLDFIQSVSVSVAYNENQMRIYKIKRPATPPNPIEHPHIIDNHDGRAWAWNGIDDKYIRIGESVTKDYDDFDDWQVARSVADDA